MKHWIKNYLKIIILVSGLTCLVVISLAIALPLVLVNNDDNPIGSKTPNKDPGNEDPGNKDPGNEDPGNEDPNKEISSFCEVNTNKDSLDCKYIIESMNFKSFVNKNGFDPQRFYTYSVHDADTFRGSYTSPAKNEEKIRIVGFDAPELNGTTTSDKPLLGPTRTKRWQEYFGDKATLAAREILMDPTKYNIYVQETGASTHDRLVGAVFVDPLSTTEVELFSFAEIIIRMGWAIPGRPSQNDHFDVGSNGISDAERQLEISIEKSFLLAYQEKEGFFNPNEWDTSLVNDNDRIAYPNQWNGKSEWSTKLQELVYPNITWWKSANRSQNEKYCTLDTLTDATVCNEVQIN